MYEEHFEENGQGNPGGCGLSRTQAICTSPFYFVDGRNMFP
jgi:hypothetical protein